MMDDKPLDELRSSVTKCGQQRSVGSVTRALRSPGLRLIPGSILKPLVDVVGGRLCLNIIAETEISTDGSLESLRRDEKAKTPG